MAQWDIDNGLVEDPEDTNTGGGMSSNAIGGLVQEQTCYQNPFQPGCPSPFARQGGADVSSLAVAGPSQAQREGAAVARVRLALVLSPETRRTAIDNLQAQIDPQTVGPYDTECSNDQLQDEQSLQTCRDRCDMCQTLDMTVDGIESLTQKFRLN